MPVHDYTKSSTALVDNGMKGQLVYNDRHRYWYFFPSVSSSMLNKLIFLFKNPCYIAFIDMISLQFKFYYDFRCAFYMKTCHNYIIDMVSYQYELFEDIQIGISMHSPFYRSCKYMVYLQCEINDGFTWFYYQRLVTFLRHIFLPSMCALIIYKPI